MSHNFRIRLKLGYTETCRNTNTTHYNEKVVLNKIHRSTSGIEKFSFHVRLMAFMPPKTIKIMGSNFSAFCNVTRSRPVDVYQRKGLVPSAPSFDKGGSRFLWHFSTIIYQTTRRHIPEESNFHGPRHKETEISSTVLKFIPPLQLFLFHFHERYHNSTSDISY